ncbi:MAG: hypothetical protein ACOYYS_09690 [Chloroflexota bacterium]
MRKSILPILFTLIIGATVTACMSNPTVHETSVPIHTSTPESAVATDTAIPTLSPTPPPPPATPTLMPLPTQEEPAPVSTEEIPTVSPVRATPPGLQAPGKSFDISYVATRTPLSRAQCPAVDPSKKPAYQKYETMFGLLPNEAGLLEQLNAGVSGEAIFADLAGSSGNESYHLMERDLTGDGIPEVVVYGSIFGCVGGQYQLLWARFGTDPGDWIAAIADMNLNGIPEIITQMRMGENLMSETSHVILEWDGSTFQNLIVQPDFVSWYNNGGVQGNEIRMNGIPPAGGVYDKVEIADVDGNGTRDLIISGGLGSSMDELTHGPWRWEKDVYTWNGQGFVLQSIEVEKPTYRFQAVQDADMYFYAGRYDVALDLYQQAVFSDQLDWWSPERAMALRMQDPYGPTPEIPPTTMPADPNDYYNLAAYSRFRIALLHWVQGHKPEAETVYNQLQESFPAGQPGSAYAELASAFWDAYQATGELSAACSQAIAYAAEHTDAILLPLGSWDHGFQSFFYQPEDICPLQ